MTTNPNWPLTVTSVAFNSGFATIVPASWTDLLARVWSLNAGRGRSYELDENQAGTGSLVLADKDEVLNPANPSPGAPYAGGILPYREVMDQAQWPPVPVGGAVNLLNAASQAPGPYDPSLESYTVGAAVPWVSAVGGTGPVVGTTTPHAGTKDLTWAVANGTTEQGAAWQVPCIPGQQYTSSVYVRQSSASTQRLQVTDQVLVYDGFQRTVSPGWGSAPVGGAWTASPSTTGFSVVPGVATATIAATGQEYEMDAGSMVDSTVLLLVSPTVMAAGAVYHVAALLRAVDANNRYYTRLRFEPDGTLSVELVSRVAGSLTSLLLVSLGQSYTAGAQYWLRGQIVGSVLQVRAWAYGTDEPSTWAATVATTSVTGAGSVGVVARAEGSNTNVPITMPVYSFSAVGAVEGSTTTTTGAYVRLTVTWTATEPLHTIQVATSGTAVAGTVLADDVQHEPGASASTATTSGPVIYGVHRGFVERWPSNWNYQGMYGYAQITTVDAFAALAAHLLRTEYPNAVLSKIPVRYWTLSEPATSTAFADTSGHGGASLTLLDSKYGKGSATPGTATNLAGDPGGLGILFNQPAGGLVAKTIAQSGWDAPTDLGIGGNAFPFAYTVAVWVSYSTYTLSPAFVTMVDNWTDLGLPITLGGFSGSPNRILAEVTWPDPAGGPDGGASLLVTDVWADGKPHLFCSTVVAANATTITLTLYVDGVSVGSAAGSGPNMPLPRRATAIQVGAQINKTGFVAPSAPNQIETDLGIWNRALTAGEIADLFAAGGGYVGENSGARISRYLGYAGAKSTNVDTGQSSMGLSSLAADTATLTACQDVTTTENGNFWATGQGTLTFTSRTRRYLSTTVKWTFGEQETPYLGDIGYDYDPQLVYNDVTVTNAGGAAPEVKDSASEAAYGPRTTQRTINVEDNNEATDAANWILATHKDPHQRVAAMTIDPASNPTLWPVALGMEIGDRVTAKRRTTPFTMQADYFVENIVHSRAPDTWTVALQMSPASLWPTPWILEDPTYGVLDSTTALGY